MDDPKFLFIRLADGVEARDWNGDDEKGAHTHHGFVPEKDNLKDIALYWKTNEKAQRQHVGTYRLNLIELRNAGYIRDDAYDGTDGFRVKFVHAKNNCVYLQKDANSPRLAVGVLE